MDNKTKYECPICGETEEVEAGVGTPDCEGCNVEMVKVQAVETGDDEVSEDGDESWDDDDE